MEQEYWDVNPKLVDMSTRAYMVISYHYLEPEQRVEISVYDNEELKKQNSSGVPVHRRNGFG
jgi:hypothetical protein